MNKLIRKNDIILALVLLAVSAAFLLFSGKSEKASEAEIYCAGELIQTIDLEHVENEYTIELGGDYNIIIGVKKNAVRFVSSDCPDKLCVNTGWLTEKGQIATCLPAATYIKVTSGGNSGIDAITGSALPFPKAFLFTGGLTAYD